MHQELDKYRHWRFKNTFLLVVIIIVFFYFSQSVVFENFISFLGGLGFLGAFIVGIFFVSTFTVVPSGILLLYLARELDPLGVVFFAGVGSALGDYIMFRFLKDRVFEELKPVFLKLGGSHISRIFSTPYFAWLSPVFGMIIIASPLPDEIGIALLGVSKLKNWQFLSLAFVLDTLGIFLIVTLANLFI